MLNVALDPEFDPSLYENEARLRDGTKVLIPPMVAKEMEALYEFFKALPGEQTRYLHNDVSSHLLIAKDKAGMPLDIAVMIHNVKRPYSEADEYGPLRPDLSIYRGPGSRSKRR